MYSSSCSMFSSLNISQAEDGNPVQQSTTVENDPEMNCTKNVKLTSLK